MSVSIYIEDFFGHILLVLLNFSLVLELTLVFLEGKQDENF